MKKQKMLIIAVLFSLIIIAISVSIWVYLDIQETKRIDAEAVVLADVLTVEYGEKVRVSNFLKKLNGTLLNDYEINTEQLGKIQVSFDYVNIKNKKRNRIFEITVIDTIEPKIFSSSSYTVKLGEEKKLEDILISGDNIDDNPRREIVGEYDFYKIGDYNLTYIVTDASGNKASKNFVLHVINNNNKGTKTNTKKDENKRVNFFDVVENYKTENTKVGIDVSKWQEKINWEEVKKSGAEFAIIRVRNSKRL